MEQKDQYDIAMLDSEYVVLYGQSHLTTPTGRPVAHRNIRIIQQIVRQFNLPLIVNKKLSAYHIFSFIAEYKNIIYDFLKEQLIDLIKNDPIIELRRYKTEDSIKVEALIEEIDKNENLLNLIFLGSSIILKGFNEFLIENNITPDYESDFEENYPSIAELIYELSKEERACLVMLSHIHKSGILLPLLYINNIICAEEYANALFAVNFHSKIKKAEMHNSCSFLNKENLVPSLNYDINSPFYFPDIINSAISIKEYISLLKENVKRNLKLTKLIKQGESTYLEFKSTLRWNLRTGKKDPAIEHANLKTISAFLNSSGGTLLIGVRDDGSIEGIETDAFSHNDKFLLHFWNLINSYIGQEYTPFVDTKLEKVDAKTVCIVKCLPSNRPAFLRQSGYEEEFYIRTGPSSSKLGISDALKYISDRFDIKN